MAFQTVVTFFREKACDGPTWLFCSRDEDFARQHINEPDPFYKQPPLFVLHCLPSWSDYSAEYQKLIKAFHDLGANFEIVYCGQTALHHYIHQRIPDLINALIVSGANVSALDQYGNTTLIEAVTCNAERSTLKLLLKHGVDVDQCNSLGKTIKDYDYRNIVSLLLKYEQL